MLTALTAAALLISQPQAVIETSEGRIVVALNETAAPVTVANFIAHAEAGNFDDGSFYRTVRDDNEREGIAPMNL
ncbi:MAG TPA: peptidylprolyl isomerase, partial [Oceanicaulis sp.]|nr:peptidylprolyl isomerase [Oceanicaulis sp.]